MQQWRNQMRPLTKTFSIASNWFVIEHRSLFWFQENVNQSQVNWRISSVIFLFEYQVWLRYELTERDHRCVRERTVSHLASNPPDLRLATETVHRWMSGRGRLRRDFISLHWTAVGHGANIIMSIVNVIQINRLKKDEPKKWLGWQQQLSLLTYDLVFILGQPATMTLIGIYLDKYSIVIFIRQRSMGESAQDWINRIETLLSICLAEGEVALH